VLDEKPAIPANYAVRVVAASVMVCAYLACMYIQWTVFKRHWINISDSQRFAAMLFLLIYPMPPLLLLIVSLSRKSRSFEACASMMLFCVLITMFLLVIARQLMFS